jgi:hypothetical protein
LYDQAFTALKGAQEAYTAVMSVDVQKRKAKFDEVLKAAGSSDEFINSFAITPAPVAPEKAAIVESSKHAEMVDCNWKDEPALIGTCGGIGTISASQSVQSANECAALCCGLDAQVNGCLSTLTSA